jgi:hypothetical protein
LINYSINFYNSSKAIIIQTKPFISKLNGRKPGDDSRTEEEVVGKRSGLLRRTLQVHTDRQVRHQGRADAGGPLSGGEPHPQHQGKSRSLLQLRVHLQRLQGLHHEDHLLPGSQSLH